MTIQIELDPVLEAKLAADALRQGMKLEGYARRLLQEALVSKQRSAGRATQEEFRAFLDALSSKSPDVPHLRTETFSRETIYGEEN